MRAKLLDISAFLDRLDRAQDAAAAPGDFRVDAMRRGFQELLSTEPGRTARIQLCLSDPTQEPIPDATGLKGASGAYAPECYVPIKEAGR
jgi:hypothetical protein